MPAAGLVQAAWYGRKLQARSLGMVPCGGPVDPGARPPLRPVRPHRVRDLAALLVVSSSLGSALAPPRTLAPEVRSDDTLRTLCTQVGCDATLSAPAPSEFLTSHRNSAKGEINRKKGFSDRPGKLQMSEQLWMTHSCFVGLAELYKSRTGYPGRDATHGALRALQGTPSLVPRLVQRVDLEISPCRFSPAAR